jgi:hypothetical protein
MKDTLGLFSYDFEAILYRAAGHIVASGVSLSQAAFHYFRRSETLFPSASHVCGISEISVHCQSAVDVIVSVSSSIKGLDDFCIQFSSSR